MTVAAQKRLHEHWPIRLLLGFLYSTVVAFILLEIFLRVADPIGIRYYFDTARYFKAMTPDSDFGYIHTSGYQATLQGVDVTINSEGLRSPQFSVDKKEGQRRLLILGDSVVFGWGAPQDSIFPAYLQRMLDEEPIDCEVVSAGVGSWNTRTECEFLRKRAIRYRPDVLVLLVVPNDVEPKGVGRTVVDQDALLASKDRQSPIRRGGQRVMRGLAKGSYLFATVQHIVKRRSVSNQLVEMYAPDSPAWKDAEDALDTIIELCGQMNTELVVFFYGDISTEFSKAFYEAYSTRLRENLVPYHVLTKRIYDKRYRNSIIDAHPNAGGHRLIAEEIFPVVRILL